MKQLAQLQEIKVYIIAILSRLLLLKAGVINSTTGILHWYSKQKCHILQKKTMFRVAFFPLLKRYRIIAGYCFVFISTDPHVLFQFPENFDDEVLWVLLLGGGGEMHRVFKI